MIEQKLKEGAWRGKQTMNEIRSLAFLACLLTALAIIPGVTPTTVNWAYPHQSLAKKDTSTGQSDIGKSSLEAVSSRATLVVSR